MRAQLLILVSLFASGISAAVHAFTPNTDRYPFWWYYTGTPILEGVAFYGIVTSDTPPPLPGLTLVYELSNSANGDYLYTTNAAEYRSLETSWYIGAFTNLYIFADNEPNTVPLYRFYNGQNHFFTTNYDEGPAAGYGLEAVAGYVYLDANNGAIPIYRWREDNWQFRQ